MIPAAFQEWQSEGWALELVCLEEYPNCIHHLRVAVLAKDQPVVRVRTKRLVLRTEPGRQPPAGLFRHVAVQAATALYQLARADYLDVLTAQRELRDARTSLIDTKVEELTAVVNTYQALGGGTVWSAPNPGGVLGRVPYTHTVRTGENFWTISRLYYKTGRYYKALWAELNRD